MSTVKIAAVGDILMWTDMIRSAKVKGGGYSFDYIFEEVAPILLDADLTIGNLETTLSGREKYYIRNNPVIGGPSFNCPDELADALKRSGFDCMTTANNHCLDRGINGLKRTLDILDRAGLKHTGTFRSFEESKDMLLINKNGIRIGILSCTYGTNGFELKKGEEWAVNYRDENMLLRIYEMKNKADFTIVCLHSGVEFTTKVSMVQKYWVQKFFEYGADAVFGVHPHVIQPMEQKRVKDVDGVVKDRFVIYSLGNFTSVLLKEDISTITGVILNLYVTKGHDGSTAIENVEYIPTWVLEKEEKDGQKFVVVPISKFIKENKNALSQEELYNIKKAWHNTKILLGGSAK